MVCKKCQKECLESELKNGICKECETKTSNKMFLTISISVIISVVIMLAITAWANNDASISDFKIESFSIDSEKGSSYMTYDGKAVISCANKEKDYIVLVESNNKTDNEIRYISVIVHEGKGELMTYDSSYTGTTEKPEYEFNIIGYRSFKK